MRRDITILHKSRKKILNKAANERSEEDALKAEQFKRYIGCRHFDH